MLGLLLLLFVISAHAGESTVTVSIEGKKTFTPWPHEYIDQTSLVVEFRVDSNGTVDVKVECAFRVPRHGVRTTHAAQGQVLAGVPTYGRFRQRVPTGFVGYDEEDWDVDCKARPLGER